MKKAFVSGIAGFVGRHMAASLEEAGYGVMGCDIKGPLSLDVRDWFKENKATDIDVFVHAAAVVGGRANIDGNPLSIAQNFAIDSDCIQWAIRNKPRKLVLFSSSAAYPVDQQGNNADYDGDRLRESAIRIPSYDEWAYPGDLNVSIPDGLYGWTKIILEIQAQKARAAGLDVVVVRPFSGWGRDQDLTYPMPSFIERAVGRADPFEIWGDGTGARDWLHIDDLCAAIMVMIRDDISGPVNLCSGYGTSFNYLAAMLCEIVGYSPSFRHILGAPKGVQYRVGDPTLMNAFYTPQMSLEERLTKIIRA